MIVAILTPRPGEMDTFRAYETKAARILARHRASIERTILEEPSAPDKLPREIHIVTFPDRASFERYRADSELTSLASMRASCIAHSELIIGRVGPDYMSASFDQHNFR